MSLEGKLYIKLDYALTRVNRVTIRSTRPYQVVNALKGKNPEQCLTMLPLLFNICANAQAYAAHSALLQVLGINKQAKADNARQILVMLETLREHSWRILLDWPGLIDTTVNKQQLSDFMQLNQRFKPLLFKQGEAFRLDSELLVQYSALIEQFETLEILINMHIFQGQLSDWRALKSEAQLLDWLKYNPCLPAKVLSYVYQQEWAGIGKNNIALMPELDIHSLQKMPRDSAFSQAPDFLGCCYESGSLNRQQAQPLLVALQGKYGNGLLVRMVSRLFEIASMPDCLRDKLATLQAATYKLEEQAGDWGIGHVQAARGLLIHAVRLKQGLVSDYQLISPTEWNFHPQGLVAESLKQLQSENKADLQQQAEMLVNAIDPCVEYAIEINEAITG